MGRGSLVTPIGRAVPLMPQVTCVATPDASLGVGPAGSIVNVDIGDARMCVPNISNEHGNIESGIVQRFDMSPETSPIPLQMAESSGSGSWIVPLANHTDGRTAPSIAERRSNGNPEGACTIAQGQ